MGNLQDQAVKCFQQTLLFWSCLPVGAFLVLAGKHLPTGKQPHCFSRLLLLLAFFFAVASWLHVPSLGVSAALSLDIASSCFLAVCPFATADPLSSWTSCLLIPLQCGACWFLVLIHSSLGFLCSCYLEGLKPYCHADCAKLFQFATLLTK